MYHFAFYLFISEFLFQNEMQKSKILFAEKMDTETF